MIDHAVAACRQALIKKYRIDGEQKRIACWAQTLRKKWLRSFSFPSFSTSSYYISLGRAIGVGESVLVSSSAWCKKGRALFPALLTANSMLRFVSPRHFRVSDDEYHCRCEYRPRLTSFDLFLLLFFFTTI